MTLAVIHLPVPPSTNALTKNVRGRPGYKVVAGKVVTTPGRQRAKTEDYKAWINDAGWQLNLQHVPKFTVPVRIDLVLPSIDNRDADNFFKPIWDILKRHGVIPDDSRKWIHAGAFCWDDKRVDVGVVIQTMDHK